MTNKNQISALILAAGSGSRMKQIKKKDGSNVNKVFRTLCDIPVIAHTIHAFEKTPCIDCIVLVTRKEDVAELAQIVKTYNFKKVRTIVTGGDTRQKSVVNGLNEVQDSDIVLIHDGARALITPQVIARVADAIGKNGTCGAAAAVRAKDSMKRTDDHAVILENVTRENLWNVQTPQGFYTKEITAFHERSAAEGAVFTDDCMAAEYCGAKVQLVEGDYANIKITTEEDMAYAEFLMTKE